MATNFNASTDYSKAIKDAIANKSTTGYIDTLNQQRNAKISAGQGGTGYIGDQITKGVNALVGNDASGLFNTPTKSGIKWGNELDGMGGSSGGDSSYSGIDPINALKEAKIASSIARLGESRDRAKSNANESAYNAGNEAASASDVSKLNFAQFAAGRGISGNAGSMPEIYANNALQGNLGRISANKQLQLNNIDTGYESDLQAARNDAEATAMQQILEKQAADRAQANKDREFALQSQNQSFNQGMQTNQYNYQANRDSVKDQQWQQTMGLDMQKQTFAEAQQKVENALRSQQINQSGASNALAWAKFNADQDPNSIDNKLKQQTIDMNGQAKQDSALNSVIQRIDSMYLTKDPSTGSVSKNLNFNESQLRSAIVGMNLPDDQTDTLLLRYGLPITTPQQNYYP